MATWRCEISLLMLKKYFTRSLRSLLKYFSTLEEKFRMSARPCNILYLLNIVLKKNQQKTHHFTECSLTLLLKITHLACNLRISQSTKANNESKILKAYIIQRPFLTGIFLEGLIYRGKFSKSATLILGGNYASQNPLGQLRVQRKFMSVICSKFSP